MYSKDMEYARDQDGVKDLSSQTQPPTNVAARQSPPSKRQSPVLRPDSTVVSEDRGVSVADMLEHERTRSPPADCVGGPSTTLSQRPTVWNPFLVSAPSVGGDVEPRDAGTVSLAKIGAVCKHSHPKDDETHSPSSAKRRKTNSEVQSGSGCLERTDVSLRLSTGQSPSSSTLDAGVSTHSDEAATTDTQDSGGVYAPDSSCDEHSTTTSDVNRFESTVQKDFTVVQETASLLSLATQ